MGNISQNLDPNEYKLPDQSFELKILLFATLKERMGQNHLQVQVDEGSTAALLMENLYLKYPELIPFSRNLIISINQNFASLEQMIYPGDEIALFPPVSGG